MKRHLSYLPVFLICLMPVAWHGCQTPTQTVAAQVAVMLATDRVIKEDPARATKAVAIADQVLAAAESDASATVATIIGLVRAKIDWSKLNPNEVAVVNILLVALEAELAARVDNDTIPADLRLKVATVAGWIKQAAAPYLPAP